MENIIIKKNIIKIPKNIKVFLCKNNILILIGPLGIKSLQLDIKIHLVNRYIILTKILLNSKRKITKKKLNFLFNVYFVILKQIIDEISIKSKQKLKIIGVGYRALILKISKFSILYLKLGYSHQIYIKIPKNILIICPKPTKIFLIGKDKQQINKLSYLIRSYKIPEPYKGKGILYDNEIIKIKEGKKI